MCEPDEQEYRRRLIESLGGDEADVDPTLSTVELERLARFHDRLLLAGDQVRQDLDSAARHDWPAGAERVESTLRGLSRERRRGSRRWMLGLAAAALAAAASYPWWKARRTDVFLNLPGVAISPIDAVDAFDRFEVECAQRSDHGYDFLFEVTDPDGARPSIRSPRLSEPRWIPDAPTRQLLEKMRSVRWIAYAIEHATGVEDPVASGEAWLR